MAKENENMLDAIHEAMSPEAVAVIVNALQTAHRVDDTSINREVAWFRDELMGLIGGPQAYNAMLAQLGM